MERDIKLVIFDLDGTLVYLPIKYERLREEMSRVLGVNKVDSILGALANIDGDLKMKIFDIWSRLEVEALPELREIDEGIKIYNKFHGKIRCLVTLQGKLIVERILKKTGLSFDHIITREDSLNRDEQIKMIIKKFNVDPREILVVGDRESDREAAKRFGCKFVFVKNRDPGGKAFL
ncbi:MAG: HAD-IA family hydrolase [Candidatus Bathyarchaeia archaeon]